MKSKPILGIDIAKKTFCYRLEAGAGQLLEAGLAANTPEGIAGFLSLLARRLGSPRGLHAGMEATGRYGEALFLALHGAGVRVSVINPAQVKYFAASLNRRGKSDPMDAALLARYVRERNPVATVPVEAPWLRLKELVGEIDNLVAEVVRVANRLGEVGRACPEVAESLGRRKALAEAEIARLEKAVLELVASEPALAEQHRLLCSIKGVAARTAARVLAHLGGKGFESARQLAAYAGLTPRENTSGTSLRGKTRLSKAGNARLRKALYIPALVFWKHCPQIKAWADAIALRTHSRKAALGAVMRKLLHVIFGVLKHRTPFDPSRVTSPSTT
jgi:transposase